MARLNIKHRRLAAGASPIRTTGVPTRTHEGGQGFARDEKSELFLLAVARFHGEDTFYETADAGSARFRELVRAVTTVDPAWVAAFLRWLRGPDANIRTAAIVGAVEYARTVAPMSVETRERLGAPTIRSVVGSVLARADEPGELLAFWISEFGRTIPSAVKRGVGDAVIRLGSEYAYAKYDSVARGVRYADVLNLVHPGDRKGAAQRLRGAWQHELFALATSAPYRDVEPGEGLPLLRARRELMALPVVQRRDVVRHAPERLAAAGMTWEALAGWLQGPMDAAAWEAVIGSMGVFALARNLRNFDEAGVSDVIGAQVIATLSDPEVIAHSRMLPFRWLAAYDAVSSDRWRQALGTALQHSTRNIPRLDGRNLVLVDNSGSMTAPMSGKSKVARSRAAALFGAALAARQGSAVDLVAYATTSKAVPLPRGGSVLRHVDQLLRAEVGWGTVTWEAVRRHYAGHDRILIFTDEQTHDSRSGSFGAARVYTWNLAGYRAGHAPSGTGSFQTVGGLSDACFRIIPLLEAGVAGSWPWEA